MGRWKRAATEVPPVDAVLNEVPIDYGRSLLRAFELDVRKIRLEREYAPEGAAVVKSNGQIEHRLVRDLGQVDNHGNPRPVGDGLVRRGDPDPVLVQHVAIHVVCEGMKIGCVIEFGVHRDVPNADAFVDVVRQLHWG